MTVPVDLVLGRDVSRETVESLSFLASKVRKWNSKINLVSKSSAADLMVRHIADSLQLVDLVSPNCEHWVDLGSGGGFPGLVIAIFSRESGYPQRLTLVESDVRKGVFLREMVRELNLPVEVLNSRIEGLQPLKADVVSARALAPLVQLCDFAYSHMLKDGIAIFPKGASYPDEIAEAQRRWRFQLSVTPSRTNANAGILTLREIEYA